MDALLYGKPMKLVDGGMQRRCYTYIDDATDAHMRIIENKDGLCKNQIINIGTNDNETTIKDLALRMQKIYKRHFMSVGQKLPELIVVSGEDFYGPGYDDCDRRLVDSSKIERLTGWKPKLNLDQMLYESIKYYVSRHTSSEPIHTNNIFAYNPRTFKT